MGTTKITITVDEHVLADIDRLVAAGVYSNRCKAIEDALQERIAKLHRSKLVRECAKLDFREEQTLATETFVGEIERPAY